MKLYAKIIDETTKVCAVGTGTAVNFYRSMGMTEQEVEQAYNGNWYLAGYAPKQPDPTKEEQSALREAAYQQEVDPITCHISRLMDGEQTAEIAAEIEALKAERAAKVAEIRAKYPYPEEAANG